MSGERVTRSARYLYGLLETTGIVKEGKVDLGWREKRVRKFNSPKLPVYNPNVIEMEFEEDKVKCRLQVNDEDYLRVREDISRIEASKLEIDLQHVKPVAGTLRG